MIKVPLWNVQIALSIMNLCIAVLQRSAGRQGGVGGGGTPSLMTGRSVEQACGRDFGGKRTRPSDHGLGINVM